MRFLPNVVRNVADAPGGSPDAPVLVPDAPTAPPSVPSPDAPLTDAKPVDPAPEQKAYYPEKLADKYRGRTDQETIDKLAGDVSRLTTPPENPADYVLDLPKETAERLGDLADDPMVPIWRELAHDLKLDNAGFNTAISKLYDKMLTAGLIDEPVNLDRELQELSRQAGDPKQRRADGERRVNEAAAWLKGTHARAVFTDGEYAAGLRLVETQHGVRLLEKIRAQFGEAGVASGQGGRGNGQQDPLRTMFPTHFE